MVKRLKEDRTLVFWKRGNFIFNNNIKDQLDVVSKHLGPEVQQESLQKPKEELQKGLTLIAARQKRIKIAEV